MARDAQCCVHTRDSSCRGQTDRHTDGQMDGWTDGWMDRHCATIRASLACASRANRHCITNEVTLKWPAHRQLWRELHALLTTLSLQLGIILTFPDYFARSEFKLNWTVQQSLRNEYIQLVIGYRNSKKNILLAPWDNAIHSTAWGFLTL